MRQQVEVFLCNEGKNKKRNLPERENRICLYFIYHEDRKINELILRSPVNNITVMKIL